MSYGLKYTLTFRDLLPITYSGAMGQLWKVNIYENSYGGSSSSVIGTDSPVTLNYKKQDIISPLCGSELTLGLMAMSNNQYDEFLTAKPLQYYIDILKSTNNGSSYSTYWSGVNTTDTYTESYASAPYPINLKFNDGLGELQWHRYENGGNLFESYEQVIQIINNCLTFLPYQKNVREIVNIREDSMLDTKGLFEQLYLSDFAFIETASDGITHGINCNKLLSNILTSLNCRMYQSNNKWYIERIYERVNNSLQYYDYVMTGSILTSNTMASSGSGVENKLIAINNSSFPKIINGSELAITKKQPALSYKLDTNSLKNQQLISNPFFENTPTAASGTPPLPLRWDRSASIQSTGGDQIETVDLYANDLKYKWGYSFGSAIIGSQRLQLKGTAGWYLGKPGALPSTYYVHATMRTGDAWTIPEVYIDSANGSIDFDIQQYLRIRINVSAVPMTLSEVYAAANTIINNLFYSPFFQVNFQNASAGNNYMNNNLEDNSYINSQNVAGLAQNTSFSNGLANCWFPNNGPIAYPLTFAVLTYYITTANLRKKPFVSGYMDLLFRTKNSFTNTLSGLLGGSGFYKFDFKVFPPFYDPSYINSLCPKINWSIQDYAINCSNLEYRDSSEFIAPLLSFYQTSDIGIRWNELSISAVYGDSLTSGYIGCFRVSNGNMTGTWHAYKKPYTFNSSTSAADPGLGKASFNNSTLSSITHIYINTTDHNGANDNPWLNTLQSGQTVIISDATSGAAVTLLAGAPVPHSTYWDMPVTVVSSSGTFSNLDSIQILYTGVVLADLLFQNYVQLCGNYRHNLKGKILGVVDYWQTVQDEDGRNYILLGHTLDIKKGQITTDMEEMSDTAITISKYVGGGAGNITPFTGLPVPSLSTAPLGIKSVSAVTKSSTVSSVTPYPL